MSDEFDDGYADAYAPPDTSAYGDVYGSDYAAPDSAVYGDGYGDVYGDETLPPKGAGAYSDDYNEYGSAGPIAPEIVSRWALYARDSDYGRLGQIDQIIEFKASFFFLGAHTWTLTMHYSDPKVALLLGDHAGIELRLNGKRVLTGEVAQMDRSWSAANGDEVVFSGFSDFAQIVGRLALPTPLTAPPFTGAIYDTVTGAAEDVLLHYLAYNVGPSAVADRRFLRLPPSEHRGAVVTEHARMDALDVLCATVCTDGHIGYDVLADKDGAYVVVYEPADKSAAVKFDRAKGTLDSFQWTLIAPKATVAYYGTQSSSPATPTTVLGVVVNGPARAKWGRIETFIDVSSKPNDGTTPAAYALAQLMLLDESYQQQINPNRTVAGVQFVTDWFIGDTVTGILDGITVAETVRQADLTIDKNGVVALPVIAGQQQDIGVGPVADDTLAALSRLVRRVSDLERR